MEQQKINAKCIAYDCVCVNFPIPTSLFLCHSIYTSISPACTVSMDVSSCTTSMDVSSCTTSMCVLSCTTSMDVSSCTASMDVLSCTTSMYVSFCTASMDISFCTASMDVSYCIASMELTGKPLQPKLHVQELQYFPAGKFWGFLPCRYTNLLKITKLQGSLKGSNLIRD